MRSLIAEQTVRSPAGRKSKLDIRWLPRRPVAGFRSSTEMVGEVSWARQHGRAPEEL